MEAMKTKQSEELQQHIHQIHAAVSHQSLSSHLADHPSHRVAHMAASQSFPDAHCLHC